ncbi:MAG: lysylphosphatidylglycerol synthetase family protein [Deltaproteobacteria bacterium]|nr:lysylphosphatidylglycerol synthetase family protein [Deltaproteobacteria bacterium]MCW5800941.1 lysylphosphatidylglycerol synthetase family protein [Deltaproteobacteria bacterium]
MTPEGKNRLLSWGKQAFVVIAFAAMMFALNKLLRSFTYEEITDALGAMPLHVLFAVAGVVGAQHTFYSVREWLAVRYAGVADLSVPRIVFASVVSRSLSTLGLSSITGIGLRLRIYEGWGVHTDDVARIAVYDNSVFLVGLVSQFGFTFTVLPVPQAIAESIGETAMRAIGIVMLSLVTAYVGWTRRGRDVVIRGFKLPVPSVRQLLGQICLPILDLACVAALVDLCLPPGVGLTYFEIVIACQVSSITSSITQVPAGIGILEATILLFAARPEMSSVIIASLFVYRIFTHLLPVLVGAVLLVTMEVRRDRKSERPAWIAEAMATVLAVLTFVIGAIVMVISASPVGDRLGDVGQILAVAAGSGMLFVARGLQRRSRNAWRVAFGLLVLRTVFALWAQPLRFTLAVFVVLGGIMWLARGVFSERKPLLVAPTPQWWIAAGMVLAGTMWSAFVASGRDFTPRVGIYFGAMLGVASIAVATATITFARQRRLARIAAARAAQTTAA